MHTDDGKVRTFLNIEVARKALKVDRDKIVELIMTGENEFGYTLDWADWADDDDVNGVELRWTIRQERTAERKRRSRDAKARLISSGDS